LRGEAELPAEGVGGFEQGYLVVGVGEIARGG
jgi:hypothetical protein